MKIALTWDYELFFGSKTGSVQRCMLTPTERLLAIAKKHDVKYTFFADVGYLIRCKELEEDLHNAQLVINQIKTWDAQSHETGLHIHPHWEDCNVLNGTWKMNLSRYKLSDFEYTEAIDVFNKYASYLNEIVNSPISSFRAGGWCIQPFKFFKQGFESNGIEIDSSVFHGGMNKNEPYFYDFSDTPNKDFWMFSEEVSQESLNGMFYEFPIFSMYYNPIFFWKLFILGRLNPKDHKPIGNGFPASGGGSKKEFLTKGKTLSVSMDGFFASKLNNAIKIAEKNGYEKVVFIGHPKAATNYSLNALSDFIKQNRMKHQFVCLRDLKK